jgi:hypothetical protein
MQGEGLPGGQVAESHGDAVGQERQLLSLMLLLCMPAQMRHLKCLGVERSDPRSATDWARGGHGGGKKSYRCSDQGTLMTCTGSVVLSIRLDWVGEARPVLSLRSVKFLSACKHHTGYTMDRQYSVRRESLLIDTM